MDTVKIHPTALVETQDIGTGTRIWAFCHILPEVHIGADCNIGDHCFIETGASVGNNVTIKNETMVWEGVTLQDGVFVGPNVLFTNDIYPRSPRLPQARARYQTYDWLRRTCVERGATLGAGAVILAGATIGEFAVIGAGAVVTKSVPAYALVLGNPAHFQAWMCQCGQPLLFADMFAECHVCGMRYVKHGQAVTAAAPEPEPA